MRNISMEDEICVRVTIRRRDLPVLCDVLGAKYHVEIIGTSGMMARIRKCAKRKGLVLGSAAFALILAVQQSFIAEVRVEGNTSIAESEIFDALSDCGLYAGCFKGNFDEDDIKRNLYKKFPDIRWVGIETKGAFSKIEIEEGDGTGSESAGGNADSKSGVTTDGTADRAGSAAGGKADGEAGNTPDSESDGDTGSTTGNAASGSANDASNGETSGNPEGAEGKNAPYDVVAKKSGYIETLIVRNGTALVKQGDYVSAGDVIISSRMKANNTTYDESRDELVKYVHAQGDVTANVTYKLHAQYDAKRFTEEEAKDAAQVAIRKYIRENIPEIVEILRKDLKFSTEKNIIECSITLEVLENIGYEKETELAGA